MRRFFETFGAVIIGGLIFGLTACGDDISAQAQDVCEDACDTDVQCGYITAENRSYCVSSCVSDAEFAEEEHGEECAEGALDFVQCLANSTCEQLEAGSTCDAEWNSFNNAC